MARGSQNGVSNNPKGKPKGAKNRLSKLAKENIADVFDHIGGILTMVDWAKENQTEFYKMYAKLIPVQMTGADDGDIKISIVKTVVEARDARDND